MLAALTGDRFLLLWAMPLRACFYSGAIASVVVAFFLARLWQPEEQIRKHSSNLLDAIAGKNWAKFDTMIADNYHDQWGNDGATVRERTREVFRYLHGVRITAIGPSVRVEGHSGFWQAHIVIDGQDDNEVMAAVKTRVNTLRVPFELEWRRMSGKPWDWKLFGVRNDDLIVPSEY